MDILLSKVTQQAMNYAIRTGITITSGYAIRQCSRLMKTVDGNEKQQLAILQLRLESKIRIISPAIDMIELIAARGNTSLESAVTLTKSLRLEIQTLGVRLAETANEEEMSKQGGVHRRSREQSILEVKLIIADIKGLLERIEDAVPLINLAITTSGVNLSTSLPATVSPSRLLQASTFLTAGDSQYSISPAGAVQIGPIFTLSMYMLFSGHADVPNTYKRLRDATWKEVIHKARVKLLRVPLGKVCEFPYADGGPQYSRNADQAASTEIPADGNANEFAYQLLIVEDLDDERVHTFEENDLQPGPYDDVALAGIRELVPIHEISKIFYADTGKILNINTDGETNNPILLLKRDSNAIPPRRMVEREPTEREWFDETPPSPHLSDAESDIEQSELDAQLFSESSPSLAEPKNPEPKSPKPLHHPWRLPPNLDPEWLAFEVYVEESETDTEEEEDSELELPARSISPLNPPDSIRPAPTQTLEQDMSKLHVGSPGPRESPHPTSNFNSVQIRNTPNKRSTYSIPPIRTSLSLLEMLIRLTALQQFQQSSHLAISDEFLTFFLSESSSVGAGGDTELRRRIRHDAAVRVGFDPYNESPIKPRGEEYLSQHRGQEPQQGDEDGGYPYDANLSGDGYEMNSSPNSYQRRGIYPSSPQSHDPRRSSGMYGTGQSIHSSPLPGGSPSIPLTPRTSSERDIPHSSREAMGDFTRASPSPLLRRATTSTQSHSSNRPVSADQANSYKNSQGVRRGLFQQQSRFQQPANAPPTAPPTSSSPRIHDSGYQTLGQDRKTNFIAPPASGDIKPT